MYSRNLSHQVQNHAVQKGMLFLIIIIIFLAKLSPTFP